MHGGPVLGEIDSQRTLQDGAICQRGSFRTHPQVRFQSSGTEGCGAFGFVRCSRRALRCAGGIMLCASTGCMELQFRTRLSCPNRCMGTCGADLTRREKLRLLIDHYCLFSDLTGPGCLRAFCAGESVELALLAGRKGTQFRVFLVSSSVVQTQREGECAVCLQRVGNPMLLSRLSFTFFLDDGGVGLAIGGLQGPAPGHKRQVIEATRDLYGLRPKDAMLLAARSIAATFAMRVHAVSDTRHVHRPLPDDPKLSSYDRYWRERSAFAGEPLGFIFPPLREPSGAPSQREATKRIIAESVRRILDVRASR